VEHWRIPKIRKIERGRVHVVEFRRIRLETDV